MSNMDIRIVVPVAVPLIIFRYDATVNLIYQSILDASVMQDILFHSFGTVIEQHSYIKIKQ